jgi:hypothetical protein
MKLDKSEICNGCVHLLFPFRCCKRGCKKDPKTKRFVGLRPLNTLTDANGYINVIKPGDCDFARKESEAKK